MFSSRIESAAAKAMVTVKVLDRLERFVEEAKQDAPKLALVNLDAAKGQLSMLEILIKNSSCEFVGYYSHVNSDLGPEARRVGFRVALSRRAFVNKLEEMLKELPSA
jgi:hypothetical protein